jgi:hypothetical protein
MNPIAKDWRRGEMTLGKQRKTFISYSRDNKEFALKLALELKEAGFPVWLDQLDIPTGVRWDDEIEKALDACDIFMVILTPSSSTSENVKDEIGYAIDSGKRLLPLLLENAKLPFRLRRFQYVDFTKITYEDGVARAKQLLHNLMEEPTVPRAEDEAAPSSEPVQVSQAPAQEKTAHPSPEVKQEVVEKQPVAEAIKVKPVEERPLEKKSPEPQTAAAGAASSGTSSSRGWFYGISGVVIVAILVFIGMKLFGSSGNQAAPTVQATEVKVELPAATQRSVSQPTDTPAVIPSVTLEAASQSATATSAPVVANTARMQEAKILVYEDTTGIGFWVEEQLTKLGYSNAKYVHDRVDDFQKNLAAPEANWDMIIVAAESKSPAFDQATWDTLHEKVKGGTPLIIETRFVPTFGKFADLLGSCGVKLQKTVEISIPLSNYIPADAIFNQPNQIAPLKQSSPRTWSSNAIDLMQLTDGSQATILAGTNPDIGNSGAITRCYDGHMILQTFGGHDYPEDNVKDLWTNYISNLLSPKFAP